MTAFANILQGSVEHYFVSNRKLNFLCGQLRCCQELGDALLLLGTFRLQFSYRTRYQISAGALFFA